MLTSLLRFSWRELGLAKTRLLLIALILTIQTAAIGGGTLAEASLHRTRDAWCDKLHLADLDVRFVAASAEEMPPLDAVRGIPGVSAADRRFVTLGNIEKSDGASVPVLIEYIEPSSHPSVDDIELLHGSWLARGRPALALVDRTFAATHDLHIGDEIVVNPRRLSSRFTIGGVGLSAEHLMATANPDTLVPRKGSLGVIYASREALDLTFPDELYNDIVVSFAEGADPQKTTDAVLAALTGSAKALEIERVVTKKSTFGYRFVEVALSGTRSVTPTISILIALMASIVAFLSMHRLVDERRREIGCLLALGFSPRALAACFFGLGLVPGALGGALGVPAAMVFAKVLAVRIANIFGLPDPIMAWDARWLALASAAAVLVGLLSALPPAIGVLRTRPSRALRGGSELRFAGLPASFEWLLSGNTSVRYAVRNVFRRFGLSLATAALVALAVALPAGLITSVSSWDTWTRHQETALGWDAVLSFKVPLSDAHVAEIMAGKGIAAWDGYVQAFASVRREDGTVEEMRVRGAPIRSQVSALHLTSGRPFSSDDGDEAILNTGFSGDRPPRVGEVVTVFHGGTPHRLVVVGLFTDATLSTIVLPRGTAQRMFGLDGKLSGAYVRYGQSPAIDAQASAAPAVASPGRDADAVTATPAEILEKIDVDEGSGRAGPSAVAAAARDTKSRLLDDDLVTSVEGRSESASATLSFIVALNVVIVPFIGLGSVLAFFFLLSVLGFLLLERGTEYATLRSMGYGRSEVTKIVLTEVGVLATAGLVLSLGTWVATAYALRGPMSTTWFWIPLDLRAQDFFRCCLPTVLVLSLAALPGIRALMRLNLSSALRGRALG